jgi:hypothetical protein
MCDVQEDMGKHLVPLTSSDEGHKIEHKRSACVLFYDIHH